MAKIIGEWESINIDFKLADPNQLPFKNNQFDIVTARGDFNAEEFRRVLKPGGLLLTSNINWLANKN